MADTPNLPVRLEPVTPSLAARETIDRRARWVAPLVRGILSPLVRVRADGAEHVPASGPCLVLANHVSQLDPVLVALAAGRPIQWMASESLLESGPLGRLAVPWGIVPKKKFMADSRAVLELLRWVRVGACVGLFPEGQRTWDGHPLPLLPGVERLARVIGAPVVTARIENADHHWPRWAAVPRSGPVRITFDPPVTWAKDADLDEIRGHLERRLTVDPVATRHWPVHGVRLAHGIGNVLFACPGCLAFEALDERGDTIRCRSCGAAWTVDSTLRLHPRAGGTPTHLRDVSDDVRARIAAAGMVDRAAFARGHVLESEPVRLLDRTGDLPVEIGTGHLRLTPTHLTLSGTDWSLPLRELAVVSAEQRRRLWFRTADRLYEPILSRESTCKWEWIAEHWRRAAR